jgi:tetratricopeptide (TPR) repeat protein
MSNLAKLSKQAVQLEHQRQFDKALALYARLFDEAGGAAEEVDVALYNRAGDAAMRVGDTATATRYYERAIDAYAAGGLLNNAIAVCNKVLRYAPDHAATHYTLAVLHAKQGFRGDAKHHFVEYAERMHRGGREDEALRALTEFAALCPPGDDVRAVLAQHLARGNRGTEVAARLQTLLDGRTPPAPLAPAPGAAADERAASLVFLDVSSDANATSAPVPQAVLGLEPTALDEPTRDEPPAFDLTADALDMRDVDGEASDDDLLLEGLTDLEMTGANAAETELYDLGDAPPLAFETFDEFEAVRADANDSDATEPDDSSDVELPFVPVAFDEAPLADLALDGLEDVDELDVSTPVALGGDTAVARPRWDDALPGELPPLSLGGWLGSAHAVVVGDGVGPDTHEAHVSEPSDPEPPTADDATSYVDLGEWLRADEPARTTRLSTDESTPTGDEAADFDRLLGIFRAGLARNIEVEDSDSHYDLGVAFREMGLIDEAIAEFQKAAQAPRSALRAREALGQCFLDRGSPELAAATLERAVAERGSGDAGEESRLLGVLYLLGEAHARLGRVAPARACFERVVASDIEFRDAVTRLTQLSASSP